MGLEAYLFRIKFKDLVDANRLHYFLENYGFKILKRRGKKISGYREGFYELASDKRITEIHLLVAPHKKSVDDIYVRFSVISPSTVVDQTFDFFKVLRTEFELVVQDTEVGNHIWLTNTKMEDRKMTNLINNIPSEEEYGENMQKNIIPLDVKEFKRNKLGIRKRMVVLKDDKRKEPIRCEDTHDKMGAEIIYPLLHLK